MPRMRADERELRDVLVMRMFIAGIPYRDIGKNPKVNLSAAGVHKVILREMKKTATRRDYLGDNAYDVHVERLESLYAANYKKAVEGDVRAGELCRRILDQLGKMHGLDAQSDAPPPRLLAEPDDEDDSDDELEQWRKKTGRA